MYTRVRLTTDRFESQGASAGMIGYVIGVHGNGDYEVELSDRDGISVAQLVATEQDPSPEPEGTPAPTSPTGGAHSKFDDDRR